MNGCIPCVTHQHTACSFRTGLTPLPCPCTTCDTGASTSLAYKRENWGRFGYGAHLKLQDVIVRSESTDPVDEAIETWLARKRGGHVLTSEQPTIEF